MIITMQSNLWPRYIPSIMTRRGLVLFFSNYHQLVEGHNFHLFTAKVLRDNMHQGLTGYPVVVERFRLPCLWCAI